MDKKVISIIVPIYNRETYLEKCIESALHQEGVITEIILIDDGSTDDSGKICDRYASLYENVKVIHKPNGGVSDSRNCGIAHAKGNYIFFLDSDDEIVENSLECLLKACVDNNADLGIGGFSRYDLEGHFLNESEFPCECRDKLVDESGIWLIREKGKLYTTDVLWGKLFKREIFRDISFPVGKINEDTYVLPKIASQCRRVYASGKVVYRQNISTHSIMRDEVSPRRLDSIDAYIEVLKYTVPKGLYNVALLDFGCATRRLIIYNRKFTDKNMREIMDSQYRMLSKISKEMAPHFNPKIRLRLWLFRRNLALYGMVRDKFGH